MVHIKGLTQVPLWYRKDSQNISCFLKIRQPETCPQPPCNSSMALPVRCSRGVCGRPPGTWVHLEEPPLGDAMPPAGHEGTGPMGMGGGEVTEGLEGGMELAG